MNNSHKGTEDTELDILSYLRMAGKRIGLLLNFNEALLKNGIERLVL